MTKDVIVELRELLESWNILKIETTRADKYRGGASQKSLNEFIAAHNAHARKLIALLENQHPNFYQGLVELANQASTLTTKGAKVFVNGVDRTQS